MPAGWVDGVTLVDDDQEEHYRWIPTATFVRLPLPPSSCLRQMVLDHR